MAWISIHEQIIGKKLRTLSKKIGCSQNEALGMLVKLWLWAINNVKKDGCIVDASPDDVSDIIKAGIDSRYDPDVAVQAMINTGWIDDYDGMLYIHDWDTWQAQWYKAISVREDAARRKRKQRERERQRKLAEAKSNTADCVTASENDGSDKKTEKRNAYPLSFEKFWKIYPRKIGKGDAYKKYMARINDGWSENDLLSAAEAYADKCSSEHTDAKYIKHPKTFLSETTPFADYIRKENDVEPEDYEDNPYGGWGDN